MEWAVECLRRNQSTNDADGYASYAGWWYGNVNGMERRIGYGEDGASELLEEEELHQSNVSQGERSLIRIDN